MRPIDADLLESEVKAILENNGGLLKVLNAVVNAPTLDIKSDVEYRWKANLRYGMDGSERFWICPVCKGQSMERTNFCSNCGSNMRVKGKQNETDY